MDCAEVFVLVVDAVWIVFLILTWFAVLPPYVKDKSDLPLWREFHRDCVKAMLPITILIACLNYFVFNI
jgi:hypothetical protein